MVIARNLGLALAASVGILLTWWRSVSLSKQTGVAEQGLITDRFIKASEQLGNKKETVRIGAIYSLWRIAVDSTSQSDKRAVLDILAAFARSPCDATRNGQEQEAGKAGGDESAKNACAEYDEKRHGKIREDIQIAMNLFAYRMDELEFQGKYTLDLNGATLPQAKLKAARFLTKVTVNLRTAHLEGAHLEEANFQEGDFEGAHLNSAYLQGANLREAHSFGTYFNKADLRGADLKGANLNEAKLQGANLEKAHLEGANLQEAHLEKAYLQEAFLEEALLQGAVLMEANLRWAHLEGADLEGADLEGAHFEDAHLHGAKIRNKSALDKAYYDAASLAEITFTDES